MYEIHWRKKWMVNAWILWDQFVLWLLQIKPLDGKNSFLKVRTLHYRGRNISLGDADEIQKGDRVVELHLNNQYLFQLAVHARSTIQLSIQLIRLMEQQMPKVSEYINNHPHREEITGIYGVSMIHRGAKQFGFTEIELPQTLFSQLSKIYLRLLLICIHPDGPKRLRNKADQLQPMVVAISRKELFQRYPIHFSHPLK